MTARRQCVRCGRSQPRERLVFSHTTRAYFCMPAEWDACDRRTRRRLKEQALLEQAVGLAKAEWPEPLGDAMLAANIGLTHVRLKP
jgi:hypothetical protein